MKYMEGLTIDEMAEKLRISPNTVKQRLFQRGIKPFSKAALYEPSTLEQISDFGPKGFQPKDKPEASARPKKAKK
ncbi:MAG: sigma-70 region 4 domain-containing protein [Treponema sp.]|nr:sigma-70 region 4 domain-containing protein [Treponema sp.]